MARLPKLTIPTRPPRIESDINSVALILKLDEVAKAHSKDRRTQLLDLLQRTLETHLSRAEKLFSEGRIGGLEMAALIASIHDAIIGALYDYTVKHAFPAPNPTRAEHLALCAVGGYGRAEMAPQSDVDLLFLIDDKKGSAHTEQITEFILYLLWDLGLKVGHATRTIDQSIALAKEDQTILTALLDLRFLRGDKDLADRLYSKFRKDITKGKGRKYIAAKLEERDVRHTREGNSRYVIEPNIKEGKGGLRDLHILYWIAKFLDKENKIIDPQHPEGYVELGLFDDNAATRFARAADYLWRTRIWLHLVSKFMREYFTNAKEVGALTRIACAKLEAEKSMRLPAGLDSFMPGSKRNLKNKALILDHGRLNFSDPMQIREDPSIIMQLFETAGRRNVDIHTDAFSDINFRLNIIDTNFRRDPFNSKIFQKTLLGAKAPYATLKAMNESGVLGRYLLEFGGIIARTQFNMHHAYTVDEHTLRLIDN